MNDKKTSGQRESQRCFVCGYLLKEDGDLKMCVNPFCSVGTGKKTEPQSASEPRRFQITWHGKFGYKVSIPNYDGGMVVDASAYDNLRAQLEAAQAEINQIADILRLERGDEPNEYFVPAEPEPIGPFEGIVEAARGFMEFVDKMDEKDRSQLRVAREIATKAIDGLSLVGGGRAIVTADYIAELRKALEATER